MAAACANATPPAGAGDFAATVLAEISELVLRNRGVSPAALKGRFDVVTECDRAVESRFAEALAKRFPEHRVFGEEQAARRAEDPAGCCWVLDPIDGTVNYAAGVPMFSISLALLIDGRPVLAWVVDPVHRETFTAERDRGATLNGEPLSVAGSASDRPGDVLPLAVSSGMITAAVRHDPAVITELTSRFGKLRNFGSQALQLCYVAASRLRGAINLEAKLWDDAAGALIATEAGARYTRIDGADVFPVGADDPPWQGRAIGSLCAAEADHRVLSEILEPMARQGATRA